MLNIVRDGLWSLIKRYIAAVISTLGVMVLFGWALDRMEYVIMQRMFRTIGLNAVLITAAVGTPLHEIAHFLGCKLFGFEVYEVVLLRPVAFKTDGILGYVSYAQPASGWWASLGAFVTGIAPMLLGSIFIILIVWLVTPELFKAVKKSIDEKMNSKVPLLQCWWAAFTGFWKCFFKLRKWALLRGIICLYLVISTAMHMTISTQDFNNATQGFGIVAALYLIFTLITAAIGTDYKKRALRIGGFIAMVLSIGLIADAVLLLIVFVL